MQVHFHKKHWYWLCQLVGWGSLWATQLQAHLMLDHYTPGTLASLTGTAVLGLGLTHGYRALLLRYQVLRTALARQALVAALGLLALALSLYTADLLFEAALRGSWPWPGWAMFAFGVVGVGRYLVVWVLAYHFFAVGERLAQAEVDGLRTAAARRQAELDLLRSQINPHFLFNALNSVRALTLSDTHRARTAVTQLADLLRYTLNYEQRQLIPLADELAAVRDYLALEQTRFGPERLRIELAVPSALHTWPVPPAALLTLVENAVKHGISAAPGGGLLRLTARPETDSADRAAPARPGLYLEVSHPGHLPAAPAPRPGAAPGGLGLANTRQRLLALYGPAARLTLRENPSGTVVAGLALPATPLPLST